MRQLYERGLAWGHGLWPNTHWQSIERRPGDVIASAVTALWCVSVPLNQAQSVWWPAINEPFCSEWPLGRTASGTWKLHFCRSSSSLWSINTTNGVIFHSEMYICPLSLLRVYSRHWCTYSIKYYMAFNPWGGGRDCLDKLSHPLSDGSDRSWAGVTLWSPDRVCFRSRRVRPVAEWLLFAGERGRYGERHQSRARKGRLHWQLSFFKHFCVTQLLLATVNVMVFKLD